MEQGSRFVTTLYDRARTEISKGALVQLALALNVYRDDIVLVGGWAPYFLTLGYFEHCGSIDIDMVLRPSVLVRYDRIQQIVEELGYKPAEIEFRFEKQLRDSKGTLFQLELDFLTEPESAQTAGLVKVQNGLHAALIPGCSVVFEFNYEQEVRGVIPGGDEASELVRVADIVGCLTMKGLALGRPRKLEKDSYDIYAVAGFHKGSPSKAAHEFKRLILERAGSQFPETAARALGRIYRGFENRNAYASQAASRFLGFDASTDATERVKAFRNEIERPNSSTQE
jgi:hypothetical protein